MSNIKDWSTTADNNNAAPPDGAPENMLPSAVNNVMRAIMAADRTQWEDGEWFNYGHNATQASGTTFTIATDVTATYTQDRRIKIADSSTLYGEIASSTYSDPNTTVTVTLDSGSLTSSMNGENVSLSIIKPGASTSIPNDAFTNIVPATIDWGAKTSFEIPNSASPTTDAAGEIAVDTTITDYTGLIQYHDGTESLYAVGLPTGNLTTTDGHVVQYDATNNEFKMAALAGGFEFIGSSTASSSSEITFTGFSSSHFAYWVFWDNVAPATNNVDLILRTSSDGGSTYDSGASDYEWHLMFSEVSGFATSGSNGSDHIGLTATGSGRKLGNAANELSSGNVIIYNPSSATYTHVSGAHSYTNGDSEHSNVVFTGARQSAADVDAIQFTMDSGNISTGTFNIYALAVS